jgi:outer membrane beta-barrel protein
MKTTIHRGLLSIGAAFVLAAALVLHAESAGAQEIHITGPLAGQPAVRHMRMYRINRFFISPSVGYTLQDEFARALFLGGSLGYHFTDWFGVSLWAAAAPINIDTDLTTQIAANAQVTSRNRLSLPSATGFPEQVGRMRFGLALQALFIPLRGKLSVFQAAFVDTDLYVVAGIALIGIQERAAVPAMGNPCAAMNPDGTTTPQCLATQSARSDRVTPAPMLGVGLSMMFNSFIGLQVEWRAFPFSWNPSGTDESGQNAQGRPGSGFPDGEIDGDDSRTTFNHMVNIGVVVYLPTEVPISD